MQIGIYLFICGIYCPSLAIAYFGNQAISTNIKSNSATFLEIERAGGTNNHFGSDRQINVKNSVSSSTLPQATFKVFGLETLYAGNSMITAVTAINFDNADSLRNVILSDNNIIKIDGGVFEKASKLENLWMNNSNIELLDKDSFKGLGNLKLLSLECNKITQLPKTIFSSLINLEHLNLGKNKLEKLENGIFDLNTKLYHIDISDNQIKYIDENVFKNIIKIEFLNITNNNIESLVIRVKEIIKLEAQNCGIKKLYINGTVKTIDVRNNRIEESVIGN